MTTIIMCLCECNLVGKKGEVDTQIVWVKGERNYRVNIQGSGLGKMQKTNTND
jgi:hypothetical protein